MLLGYAGNANVMLTQSQQIPASSAPHLASGPRHQVVYANQMPHSQSQPTPMSQNIVQQEQSSQPKKKTVITLKDPNTGKDLTNELLKKSKEKRSTPTSGYSSGSSASNTPPLQQDDKKAQIQAAFAAQVNNLHW